MILLDFLAYVTFYDVVLCVLVVKKCNQKIATRVPSSFVDICIHLCSSASTKAFWSQIVKAHTRRIMAADGNVSFEDALNATNYLKLVNLDKGPQFLESHMCSGHFDATGELGSWGC